MNIVFYTRLFFPHGGGSVNIVDNLCRHWAKQGHQVSVITPTQAKDTDNFTYEVLRTKSFLRIFSRYKKAGRIFFMENSLPGMFIAKLACKKYTVTHQANFMVLDGFGQFKERARRALGNMARQIACSNFIAAQIPDKMETIGNPYDDATYKNAHTPIQERPYRIAFVGRITEEKGIYDFIKACLSLMEKEGGFKVAIIGDGNEKKEAEKLTKGKWENMFEFKGWLSPAPTAETLQQSSLLVVPSRFPEPFGIVALEGLACGCRLVTSDSGGLQESGGGLAYVFRKGDIPHMTEMINQALQAGEHSPDELLKVNQHLEKHSLEAIAKRYLV